MHEFIEDIYGNIRNDNQIINHAVSSYEPKGKPLDRLRLVPVKLTIAQPDDEDILRSHGDQWTNKTQTTTAAFSKGSTYSSNPSPGTWQVSELLPGIWLPD